MFGQLKAMTAAGLTWEINCNGKDAAHFALGIRLDDLGHVTWLTVNLLEAARHARFNTTAGGRS
ncbi:hypothetical protein D3C81_1934790 [compost metagenome]